ncbi:MAG: ABC transporter permease [Solirubrobacteraceae bacterium]
MLGLIAANVRRRATRTGLTAAGIAVGVAAVVALLALSAGLNQTAGQLVHLGKADLGLFQADASDPTTSLLPLSLLPKIRSNHDVTAATPLQMVVGAIPSSPASFVFGVDPNGFVAGRLVFVKGSGLHGGEADVGDLLAAQLHLHVSSTIVLNGKRFPVAAIFHSGVPFEDQGVITTLGDAQALADRTSDEATTIAVRLAQQVSTAAGARSLQKELPGVEVIDDPTEAIRSGVNNELISKAVLLIVVLALIIGVLSVANTMLAAILERRRELVLLATIGWSSSQLAVLVLGEAIAVSIIGTAAGLVLGTLASGLLPSALGLQSFISPELTTWGLGRACLIGVTIGVLGAVYPIWRVTRISSAAGLAPS